MAAIPAVIDKLIFQNITGELVVEDITDYASYDPATVSTWLKITVTDGSGNITVIYDNLNGVSADIIPATSLFNQTPITMPLDSDGNILQGTYTLYSNSIVVYDASPLVQYLMERTVTYDYDFEIPEICLSVQVNCEAATVTSRDETDYGAYATTITRVHTIFPNPVQGTLPKVGTQSTLIFNGGPDGGMYTGPWYQSVSTTVTFTFANGSQLITIILGSKSFTVDCDTVLCTIRCCLNKLIARWARAKRTNPKEANEIWECYLEPTKNYIILYLLARDCGSNTDMVKYKDLIVEKSGCSDECSSCNDGSPQLITPIVGGGSGTVIVDSPDGSITVVPEVIGTTTYYHTQVSAAIQNIINNLNPVIVSTNTPAVIGISSSGVNPKTFFVDWIGNAPVQENHIEIRGKIERNPSAGAAYIFTPLYVCENGVEINPNASYVFVLGQTIPNVVADIMLLDVSNFVLDASAPLDYTVGCQLMRKVSTYGQAVIAMKDLEVECCWFDLTTDRFVLRFYNPIDGTPRRFSDLQPNDEDIYFRITIYVKPT